MFEIWTSHDTRLCRLDGGQIGHCAKPATATPSDKPLILAVRPAPESSSVLLFDVDGSAAIGTVPDAWQSLLYPLWCLPQLDGRRHALAHPYSGNLLIALPIEPGTVANRCVISGVREAGDWECFRLEPWLGPRVAVMALAERAKRLQAAARAGGLRGSIERDDSAEDREVIARLAAEREFEELAVAVQDDPVLRGRFMAQAGTDPYAVGLGNLLRAGEKAPKTSWFGRKRKSSAPAIDLVNDGRFSAIGSASQDGTYSSCVQKLNAVARRRHTPTRRLCALATMRDEGPYILEWLAYHRCIGVEHFFVYSNDNTDGSDALLAALAKNGIITWIENKDAKANIQLKAYGHCLSIVPGVLDYDWCALLDADEFLCLHRSGAENFNGYLDWQEGRPVDVIALPWAIFWSSGRVSWTDEPSIERFNRQSHGSGLGKSLFRPRKFTFSYPHHPASCDRTLAVIVRDSVGEQIRWPRGQMTGHELPPARYETAWINHYFSRSAEELLWKWSRGRGDSAEIAPFAGMPDDFISGFMANFTHASMDIADGMTSRYPAMRQELAALTDLPGVRAAREAVTGLRHEWAARTPALVARLKTQDLSQLKRSFLDLLPS